MKFISVINHMRSLSLAPTSPRDSSYYFQQTSISLNNKNGCFQIFLWNLLETDKQTADFSLRWTFAFCPVQYK